MREGKHWGKPECRHCGGNLGYEGIAWLLARAKDMKQASSQANAEEKLEALVATVTSDPHSAIQENVALEAQRARLKAMGKGLLRMTQGNPLDADEERVE